MRELFPFEEIEQVVPFFHGREGLAHSLKRLFRMSRLEDLVWRHSDKTGVDFASDVLDELGVDYEIGGPGLDKIPEGAFFTIHNHPYGGVDGCALIDFFGRIDPQYKLMVNKVLSRVWPLEQNYITVIPTGEHKTAPKTESIGGVRDTITAIRSGHPVGIFPSGAVSDLSLRDRCVRDREWQSGAVHLIKKLGVPIVPVRFFDGNSAFYYSLGLISWKVRLLRLPSEIFNKNGKRMRIGIGPVTMPDKLKEFDNVGDLTGFLRSLVYDMPMPDKFVRRSELLRQI